MGKNTLRLLEIFLVISNDILSFYVSMKAPFSMEIYLLLLVVAQCANNVLTVCLFT